MYRQAVAREPIYRHALPCRWWLRHLGDLEPRDDQFGQLLQRNSQPGEPKLPDRRALEGIQCGIDRGTKQIHPARTSVGVLTWAGRGIGTYRGTRIHRGG